MLMTIKELAEKLNVKESWIRSRVFKREIPFIKVGKHVRFDLTVIDEWLKLNKF